MLHPGSPHFSHCRFEEQRSPSLSTRSGLPIRLDSFLSQVGSSRAFAVLCHSCHVASRFAALLPLSLREAVLDALVKFTRRQRRDRVFPLPHHLHTLNSGAPHCPHEAVSQSDWTVSCVMLHPGSPHFSHCRFEKPCWMHWSSSQDGKGARRK
jgi:hypothetical protein